MIAGPYSAQKTGCSHECPVSCDPVGIPFVENEG